MFLPAHLPYLAIVKNCKAFFPGDIHAMAANTSLRALFYLISGEMPVMAEPGSPLPFICSLSLTVMLHTHTAPIHSHLSNICTNSRPGQSLTFDLFSFTS